MTDFPKDSWELVAHVPVSVRFKGEDRTIWRRAIWRQGDHYRELTYISDGAVIARPGGPLLIWGETCDANDPIWRGRGWIVLNGPGHSALRRQPGIPSQVLEVEEWEAIVANPYPTWIRLALA